MSDMKALEGTPNKRAIVQVSPSSRGKDKTIVVLGVERGGTSMVAGMIRALGVDMGERAGRNHEDPSFLTDDKQKLVERIKQNNESKSIWGFKVPKASLMLEFYGRHLRNPHYVLVFRNIEATVDSWCSRGANDPMSSALHAIHYYDQALKFLKENRSPLIFANYERACADPKEFARLLAEFIGVQADEVDIERAASIVTGEGGGYIDLPEYYFHVDAINSAKWPSEMLMVSFDNNSERMFPRSDKMVNDRIIICPDGKYFPKEFYVGLNLETDDREFEYENGLRIYMDFTGKFFPGHAFRPEIHPGKNLFKISNNGNVRRIALGPLRNGYVFGVSELRCYKASKDDVYNGFEILPHRVSPARLSIVKRFVKKIRALI